MKVAFNACWGGFHLSATAIALLASLKAEPEDVVRAEYEHGGLSDSCRSDPLLIAVIEELGPGSNGPHSQIEIVCIPDGMHYEIMENDGLEDVVFGSNIFRGPDEFFTRLEITKARVVGD